MDEKTASSTSDGSGAARPDHDGDPLVDVSTLPRVRTWAVAVAATAVVLGFGGLFVLGFLPRRARLAALRAGSMEHDPRPTVEVARPKRPQGAFDLRLPADVRSMQDTSMFPRANGYLKRILVDIGDRVKAGQLLAEIDTPEIDAELLQAQASAGLAEANLARAQSDFELADTTLKRYTGFAQTGGVTQQQLDERRSTFTQARSALDAAKASVAAAHADVQRLTALQGFERIVSPFDGLITSRNYDVGALLSPGTNGRELLRVERTDVLRVFVNVPQSYVTSVQTGQEAHVQVRNYPGREFAGTVARSAGALDPQTRTLRYQIDVPNSDGSLFAGMYGEARLAVSQPEPPIVVPSSALAFDASGTRVWVVEENRVHAKPIVVGLDLGTEIEVASGLTGDESVVTNPGERLADGTEVRLAPHTSVAGAPKERTEQVSSR